MPVKPRPPLIIWGRLEKRSALMMMSCGRVAALADGGDTGWLRGRPARCPTSDAQRGCRCPARASTGRRGAAACNEPCTGACPSLAPRCRPAPHWRQGSGSSPHCHPPHLVHHGGECAHDSRRRRLRAAGGPGGGQQRRQQQARGGPGLRRQPGGGRANALRSTLQGQQAKLGLAAGKLCQLQQAVLLKPGPQVPDVFTGDGGPAWTSWQVHRCSRGAAPDIALLLTHLGRHRDREPARTGEGAGGGTR